VFNFFLDAGDHDATLELLQAFCKHQPPVIDAHYILRYLLTPHPLHFCNTSRRYLSVTVCCKKDSAILKRIIAFAREHGMRNAMFSDVDGLPSVLAAKSGNLSAVVALQV